MQPEVIILQLTRDQLQNMLHENVEHAVSKVLAEYRKTERANEPLLGVPEICRFLGISRSRFETYKDELIGAGMFKIGHNNGSFKMKKEDFEVWLSTKQVQVG